MCHPAGVSYCCDIPEGMKRISVLHDRMVHPYFRYPVYLESISGLQKLSSCKWMDMKRFYEMSDRLFIDSKSMKKEKMSQNARLRQK